MTDSISDYDHLVTIDDNKSRLTIYRVLPDGTKVLYTSVELPKSHTGTEGRKLLYERFGSALLLDSPARGLLNFQAQPPEQPPGGAPDHGGERRAWKLRWRDS